MARKRTNEWEFQGQILTWVNALLSSHQLSFDRATQEFPNSSGKRSDVVVWRNHAGHDAVLEVELKTTSTPLSDGKFQADAITKAQRLGAPYVAQWNMRQLKLYRTPNFPRKVFLESDLVAALPGVPGIDRTEDWLTPQNQEELKDQCLQLLLSLFDLVTRGTIGGAIVDATVFVESLTERVRSLRAVMRPEVDAALARNRRLRASVEMWAQEQGLTEFVDDLHESLTAQIAYRIVGQALFYFSFRRQYPSLPEIVLYQSRPLLEQLRVYWDAIRSYDYEALFETSPLEAIGIGPSSSEHIADLINDLAAYDWDKVSVDVLGAIFERLIPEPERIVLGQYYTPPHLADLLVSLVTNGTDDYVLDPAVGTGTFLLRFHDRLRESGGHDHEAILTHLWGFDISAFAAELATINICRTDLSSQANFPRIAVRDFFTVSPDDTLAFPPARRLPGAPHRVDQKLPQFDSIVGNPPYIRSQQLDDLDTGFKDRLHLIAAAAHMEDSKLDAFGYFLIHATQFLKPGGRMGFVTSAAWLTSSYGNGLKAFLLANYRIPLIVWSSVEPFFPEVDVNTVLLILEKLTDRTESRNAIRFVTLTRRLADIVPHRHGRQYWQSLDQMVARFETAPAGLSSGFRVHAVDGDQELQALRSAPAEMRNWSRPLKESEIYRDLFEVGAT